MTLIGQSLARDPLYNSLAPSKMELPKYPRRALHLLGSEARFGGGGVKLAPYFLDWVGPYLIS